MQVAIWNESFQRAATRPLACGKDLTSARSSSLAFLQTFNRTLFPFRRFMKRTIIVRTFILPHKPVLAALVLFQTLSAFVILSTTASLAPPHLPGNLASTNTLPYDIGSPILKNIYVSPTGNPDADGSSASAPTTLLHAWGSLVPRTGSNATATTGYRIYLLPGTYGEGAVPYYMENAHGTWQYPIVIQSLSGRSSVTITQFLNIYNCRFLYLLDLNINTKSESLHFEACHYVLLRNVVANGNGRAQETLKANQCSNLYVEGCDISGSGQAALDYVAVQSGHILNSRFHEAGDWCLYLKGGSSYFRIDGNEMFNCFTGGFTAGQGTGFEFMVSPWLYYEALDIKFTNNRIHDVYGACFGCNGCAYSLFAFNNCTGTGNRSHLLEFVPGSRNCRPEDAVRCAKYHDAGGWGPSLQLVENEVIPIRNVYVFNNRIINTPPDESMWVHLAVWPPQNTTKDTNVPSPVRLDDGLVIRGNFVRNGDIDKQLGVGEDPESAGCWDTNPTCNRLQLLRDNNFNSLRPNVTMIEPIPDFPAWVGSVMARMPVGAVSNAMITRKGGLPVISKTTSKTIVVTGKKTTSMKKTTSRRKLTTRKLVRSSTTRKMCKKTVTVPCVAAALFG